jgi:hypothetical protein
MLSCTTPQTSLKLTVPTQRHGTNFRSISDGERLKHSPRNTAEDLCNLQVDDVLGGEEDGGEADDENQAGHDSVSVAEFLGHEAVDEETDDLADVCSVGQTCLPRCWDLPCSIWKLLSIFSARQLVSAFP